MSDKVLSRFVLSFLSITAFFVFSSVVPAQSGSSCSCTSPTQDPCSASITCTTGFAQCSCTMYGCSSSCRQAPIQPPSNFQGILKALDDPNERAIEQELSNQTGSKVEFVKDPDHELSGTLGVSSFKSYWDVMEFLASKGELTISGLPFDAWKTKRNVLLKGGSYRICGNEVPAQWIVDEINFLTEKNYAIVSGNPRASGKTPVHGNTLMELLSSLEASRNIRIVDRSK
jgi:hypothetical protein